MISTIEQGSGENAMNFAYTYDSRGNIVSETRNGVTTTYEYDELGQLIRVNDPNDPAADSVRGTTWVYSYDRGGNILQKLAYVLSSDAHPSEIRQSLIYEYTDTNWKDKLTLFCNDELEYDAIGNLTDDGQWTYTWEKGRQLKSMHNASTGVTMEFKYNHSGIRTQKIKKVNGTVTETTDYILKGKLIAAMKKNTDTYYFTYDAADAPVMVNFNGANYTYVKNLQGDIVGILDASGNMVVEYMYDAWGDAVSIYSASTTVDSLAFDNPFRYRGYVWDDETGLYYLRSRYYDPELGRFLNADTQFRRRSIIGANLFAYCNNNAILYVDNDGYEPEIAPSPSRPIDWDEQFVEYFYFSASSKYYRGKPNSHITFQLPNGEWRERWYGEDGYAIRDRHWSNHGNSKKHPWVPHDEDWTDNGKGGKSIDSSTMRPSPEGVKHPTEKQEDDEEPPKDTIKASDVGGVIVYLIGIGAFIFSLGRIPPTAFAY